MPIWSKSSERRFTIDGCCCCCWFFFVSFVALCHFMALGFLLLFLLPYTFTIVRTFIDSSLSKSVYLYRYFDVYECFSSIVQWHRKAIDRCMLSNYRPMYIIHIQTQTYQTNWHALNAFTIQIYSFCHVHFIENRIA